MTTTRILDHGRDLRHFLAVPPLVYQGDPNWVPPVRVVMGARLRAEHFGSPEAHFRLILAERDGRAIGRCAVFRDPAHDRHKDENVVFFGFFDALDREVATALIEAASDVARSWNGELLRGPRGLTRIDRRGILVEGHHLPPFLASHHPAWYRDFFEQARFEKNHDALAYEIDLLEPDGRPRPIPDKLARKADGVSIEGLEVRPFRWSSVLGDLDLAHEVMVDAFRDVPDNTPIPRATFRAIGAPFLALTHREMLQLATVDGRAAGFALCVPEVNEALHHAGGSAGPSGWLGAWRGRAHMRTASFKLLGVLPEYRGSGLHALLIREACLGVQRAGYSRLEASLIDARNKPMRTVVESAGMTIYRRYRVFERAL